MLGSGGGELCSGNSLVAREHTVAAVRESGSVGPAVCVVLFPLICIVVVPVPSVCCSVKLPLSQPTSFCLFLSILLRTLVGGGMAAWRFCCRPQPKPEHIFGTQAWGGDNSRAEQQVLKQLS